MTLCNGYNTTWGRGVRGFSIYNFLFTIDLCALSARWGNINSFSGDDKMNRERTILLNVVILVIVFGMAGVSWAGPMSTAFTYQGILMDANSPAEGFYDFEFELYDQDTGGNQVGNTVTKDEVEVIDGYFTAPLDFVTDPNVFNGDLRWLAIAVRPGASSDPCDFATLSPRQELTPTPYAIHSGNADTLDSFDSAAFAPSMHDHDGVYALISHHHDDSYYTQSQLQNVGEAIVRWDNISNTPAGFGDGDDDTQLTEGEVDAYVANNGYLDGGSALDWDNITIDMPAGFADGVDNTGAADSDWTISGSDMYTSAGVTGNVGIGTSSPAAKLTVDGAILRDGSTMYGSNAGTHINLGTASTTGTNGEDYDGGTVGGGESNAAAGEHSTVSGGIGNAASSYYATVGGGFSNTASFYYATVGGGAHNTASGGATIGGGYGNTASGSNSTIGGGDDNIASSDFSTVGGGEDNTASGAESTVGGGQVNEASGHASTVGGGYNNTASDDYAAVGGGYDNDANSLYATVPGGYYNAANGDYSFAAGRRAKANHDGAFVWADSTNADFASTADDQFLIRASGGVGINTASPARSLHVNDVMRLEPRASAPGGASEGDMFMDSTTHKLMVYDGSTWQACW